MNQTSAFQLVDRADIPSLNVALEQYRHEATGARHLHLASADSNNAFMVAFPTLPDDSTGVAHILEHTTLCGSERFPVRDPFFMMLRRSLNTFMNAFTSGDSTAYPFATQNRKDFDNLLGVYLDAVFFPQLHELDFAQEGWRVEPGEDQHLQLHGVVYNEMKGAMSSPVAQLWQHVHTALFPDTVYRHNSGGDPLDIPQLTYDALRAFHARHYHPSNAVFMTYGSFPVQSHQQQFEALALSRFNQSGSACVIPRQSAFAGAREVTVPYATSEQNERATHAVWAWLWGDNANPRDLLEGRLLASILLEHSASPLRHLLETTPLANAPSELCGLDDSAQQLVFVCGVEGTSVDDVAALEQQLFACIGGVAAHGVASEQLEAALDQLELDQRDIGAGAYPFGLQLMGRLLPAALYGRDPAAMLDPGATLAAIRSDAAAPDYIQGLARRLLANNQNRARVTMYPDPDQAARDAANEADWLSTYQANLSAAQRQELETQADALRRRQAQADDDSVLPRVTLDDVPAAGAPALTATRSGREDRIAEYLCGTNGIFRARLAMPLPSLDAEEMAALPLWCEYLTELGAGDADYLAVQRRRARSGEYSVAALVRPALGAPEQLQAWLVLYAKGLARNRDVLLGELVRLLPDVRFDEIPRLTELVQQSRAEAEQGVSDRGHQLAMVGASARFSASSRIDELWDGASAVRFLQHLDQADDPTALKALAETFTRIRSKVSGAAVRAALIGDDASLNGASATLDDLLGDAPALSADTAAFVPQLPEAPSTDAWITDARVNFCARAWAAPGAAAPDAATLAVLGKYLQDGFLHREIREQGGAYGSGAVYDADALAFRMFSYRDPRSLATLEDFGHALTWFAQDRDAQRLEESILGVIRGLDQPRAPAGEADRDFANDLFGRDQAFRDTFRGRVLEVTHDALRAASERYLTATPAADCVVASRDNEVVLAGGGFTPGLL